MEIAEQLINKINSILKGTEYEGEFWIVCANKTGYTVYAENVCFDVLDE